MQYQNLTFDSISTDTRNLITLTSAELLDTLFIALTGDNFDGHSFVERAYKIGVRKFIVSKDSKLDLSFVKVEDKPFITSVENTLETLQYLAKTLRDSWQDTRVIAITGSYGKTIVKEWLRELLPEIATSPGSYNSQVGVPLSVFALKNSRSSVKLFECGISRCNEMQNLQKILTPEIGILTNIGSAHDSGFNSFTEKLNEKLELFKATKTLFLSSLDKRVFEYVQGLNRWSLISCGVSALDTLKTVEVATIKERSVVTYQYQDHIFSVTLPFSDSASLENYSLTLLFSLYLLGDRALPVLITRSSLLKKLDMRLSLKSGKHNSWILDDGYINDIHSFETALDYFLTLKLTNRRLLVLTDMSEGSTEEDYTYLFKLLEKSPIDEVFFIGKIISAHITKEKFAKRHDCFATTEEFLQNIELNKFALATIMIKGARTFQIERVTSRLEARRVNSYLEVNLPSIFHNYQAHLKLVRKHNPSAICIPVVKANAYGMGAYPISAMLEQNGVSSFAVALISEGVELRENGIKGSIIVLNPDVESGASTLVDYNLEPELFSLSAINIFKEYLQSKDITSYPVHLKLDTGMHRFGLLPKEVELELDMAAKLNKPSLFASFCFKIKSIITHLSSSDEEALDSYTLAQGELFASLYKQITDNLGYYPYQNVLNSFGIERFPSLVSKKALIPEVVRLGIGLYGVLDPYRMGLRESIILKSSILQIKETAMGEAVGYNRKEILARDSRLAVLGIGYADGLNRFLSCGKGSVFIDGKEAPIVGNICMDSVIVDITDIITPMVTLNSNVIIIGGEANSFELVAKKTNTIVYEVLTSISTRVERVYTF